MYFCACICACYIIFSSSSSRYIVYTIFFCLPPLFPTLDPQSILLDSTAVAHRFMPVCEVHSFATVASSIKQSRRYWITSDSCRSIQTLKTCTILHMQTTASRRPQIECRWWHIDLSRMNWSLTNRQSSDCGLLSVSDMQFLQHSIKLNMCTKWIRRQ